MTHMPLPLPVPAPVDDEFDLSDEEPTQFRIKGVEPDIYIDGMERAAEWLNRNLTEQLRETNGRIDRLATAIGEVNERSKEIKSEMADLRGAVDRLGQWLREESAARVAQEQPRTPRKRK